MAFFVFTFIAGSMIGLTFEGANGMSVNRVTQQVLADDLVIPVGGVDGFLSADFLRIGDESLYYTSKTSSGTIDGKTCPCFGDGTAGGLTRGAEDPTTGEPTEAANHTGPFPSLKPPRHGASVYNSSSSVVNQAVGFNFAEQMGTSGALGVITLPLTFGKVVAKLIAWDFAFLDGKFVFFKYLILYPISAGFVWTMWTMLSGTALGLFKRPGG